ncbi:hypothetical protein STEG23_004317 [Scotinomys teguina]
MQTYPPCPGPGTLNSPSHATEGKATWALWTGTCHLARIGVSPPIAAAPQTRSLTAQDRATYSTVAGLAASRGLWPSLYPRAKVHPPPRDIKVSHSDGQLRLDWNVSDEVQAEVQFRRQTPTTNWTLGDCGPQDNSGLGVIEDIHGSSSEPFPQPEVHFLVERLGQGGRRNLIMQAQLKTSKTVLLGKTLKLSGAAYDLVVVTKTRFGPSPNQTWHLPALNLSELLPEMRTLNVSMEGNVTSMHWAAQAPDTTYCVEWQAQSQGRNHTHCTLIAPEDGDPARTVTHSWSSEPALDQEECYRISVFASKDPEKPLLWSTVLSSYYFGGNTSVAGTPRLVSVKNHSGDSVSVEWMPSRLSSCPGVLTRYVVRCEAEDGEWASAEWLVPPAETRVTLQGLRSGVVYKVQVRADTARLPGAWSLPQRVSFVVWHSEAQISRLAIIFASLGSFASVLLLGGLGYVGLNRAAWHLCPPLPTPCASTAVEFPGSQGKQGELRPQSGGHREALDAGLGTPNGDLAPPPPPGIPTACPPQLSELLASLEKIQFGASIDEILKDASMDDDVPDEPADDEPTARGAMGDLFQFDASPA